VTSDPTLLEVRNLCVAYRRGEGWALAVEDVSFSLRRGEVFGLVGESGCGKSTIALQLLGYRHGSMRVERGDVRFKGQCLTAMSRPELDRLRGDRIAFVPQNPTTALNPGMRIEEQLAETMLVHGRSRGAGAAVSGITDILGLVGLPGDAAFRRRYPHQLSGGQQQRVAIAMALACGPDLLVLDEPTTGLDVTTQEQIISLLIGLRRRIGVSMLYVTHDLALLSQIADRIGVMYAGRMVEIAPTNDIFLRPRHPYTQGLIASIPTIEDLPSTRFRPLRGLLQRRELPPGCPFAPRCDHATERCAGERQELRDTGDDRAVACWRWRDIAPIAAASGTRASPSAQPVRTPALSLRNVSGAYGSGSKSVRAASDVSFEIMEGEVFALVGESGSGKSTLARAISGLESPRSGTIELRGQRLAGRVRQRTDEQRRLIQYIFQNPDASLNPRARIGATIARPLVHFFGMDGASAHAKVADALSDVRLDVTYEDRFPDQLSGGERQRVAIARALAASPVLLLCDEILSALDVSVQANILALLEQLKSEHGIAMLFISHDLAVVRMLADQVCVLFGGQVMQIGPRERVFAPPFHPYTHSLLHAVPVPLRPPDEKSASARPGASGTEAFGAACVYAGRCPWRIGTICETERPPWRELDEGGGLRCHLTPQELSARADWPPSSRCGKHAI
jgi:peptide/nickel transport system ATP-binding protein